MNYYLYFYKDNDGGYVYNCGITQWEELPDSWGGYRTISAIEKLKNITFTLYRNGESNE